MANLDLTRQWAENIYQLETTDPVMGGPDGVDNRQAKELGARTNWLKDQVDTINRDRTGYAPKASPAFTGIPTAPTAAAGTNNAQIATTAFVKTAIAALVGSAPAALDTLEELARALAGDANLKATLLAEIGKKANATDFNALHDLFIGIPIPYPLSTVPTGCLAMNGQRFDTRRYPKLAQKYPSGQLPDLRGEFIRGWDNGRGVDAGRGMLSVQSDEIKSHNHKFKYVGQNQRSESNRTDIFNQLTVGDSVYRHDRRDDLIIKVANESDVKYGKTPYNDVSIYINNTGGSETRPRNIAYQYICLAE
jgi:hypothetical protein|nr:MAG TPA: Baseplate wedge protein [Caudoviricetes sp.]